jgi:hypothetical protein
VTCRAHGWRYDATTDSTMTVPGYGVRAHPAKVVDGMPGQLPARMAKMTSPTQTQK